MQYCSECHWYYISHAILFVKISEHIKEYLLSGSSSLLVSVSMLMIVCYSCCGGDSCAPVWSYFSCIPIWASMLPVVMYRVLVCRLCCREYKFPHTPYLSRTVFFSWKNWHTRGPKNLGTLYQITITGNKNNVRIWRAYSPAWTL